MPRLLERKDALPVSFIAPLLAELASRPRARAGRTRAVHLQAGQHVVVARVAADIALLDADIAVTLREPAPLRFELRARLALVPQAGFDRARILRIERLCRAACALDRDHRELGGRGDAAREAENRDGKGKTRHRIPPCFRKQSPRSENSPCGTPADSHHRIVTPTTGPCVSMSNS